MTRGVEIWTDGACSGNPGPGGWGAILRFGDREKEINGGEPLTTNNRMELMAAIMALETLNSWLRGGSPYRIRNICAAESPHGSPAGKRAAGAPPTESRLKTSICGKGWKRRRSGMTSAGIGSKAIRAMT